jgi:hypothetical protein
MYGDSNAISSQLAANGNHVSKIRFWDKAGGLGV